MRITILHANSYNFNDQKTGRNVSGIKLSYIFSTDLQDNKISDNEKGFPIAESVIPIEHIKNIRSVPGIYEADFSQSVDKQKRVVQKLLSVEYVEAFGNKSQEVKK